MERRPTTIAPAVTITAPAASTTNEATSATDSTNATPAGSRGNSNPASRSNSRPNTPPLVPQQPRMSLAARTAGSLIELDDLAIYRNAFRRRDLNGNGTLEKDEVEALVKSLYQPSEKEMNAVFDEIDTNKDNRVCFDEYYAATSKLALHTAADRQVLDAGDDEDGGGSGGTNLLAWMDDKLGKMETHRTKDGAAALAAERQMIHQQFQVMDHDHDGYISRVDARRLAFACFIPPVAVVQKVTAFLTNKKTSSITEVEFINAMHRCDGYLPNLLRASGVVAADWNLITAEVEAGATLIEVDKRIMRVSAIAGIGLPKMDVIGTADPYLKLQFLAADGHVLAERKSAVHKNTLNPKFDWHVDLSPEINTDPARMAHSFRIECWDEDTINDDFIGELNWEMKDLDTRNFSIRGKFDLLPRGGVVAGKKRPNLGQLELIIVYRLQSPYGIGHGSQDGGRSSSAARARNSGVFGGNNASNSSSSSSATVPSSLPRQGSTIGSGEIKSARPPQVTREPSKVVPVFGPRKTAPSSPSSATASAATTTSDSVDSSTPPPSSSAASIIGILSLGNASSSSSSSAESSSSTASASPAIATSSSSTTDTDTTSTTASSSSSIENSVSASVPASS